VLLGADKTEFAHGMICVAQDKDKSFTLGAHQMMVAAGEPGDVKQFGEYVEKNIHLYKYRHGYEMPPPQAAHFARKEIADELRRSPQMVELLLAGWDLTTNRTYLASVDYLGNKIDTTPFVFRGIAGKFCYSILDRVYTPTMSEQQAVEAVRMCVDEVRRRFVAHLPQFNLWVINKDGIRKIDVLPVNPSV